MWLGFFVCFIIRHLFVSCCGFPSPRSEMCWHEQSSRTVKVRDFPLSLDMELTFVLHLSTLWSVRTSKDATLHSSLQHPPYSWSLHPLSVSFSNKTHAHPTQREKPSLLWQLHSSSNFFFKISFVWWWCYQQNRAYLQHASYNLTCSLRQWHIVHFKCLK